MHWSEAPTTGTRPRSSRKKVALSALNLLEMSQQLEWNCGTICSPLDLFSFTVCAYTFTKPVRNAKNSDKCQYLMFICLWCLLSLKLHKKRPVTVIQVYELQCWKMTRGQTYLSVCHADEAFVDQLVCFGVSWLSFHNVALCCLIGQGDSWNLEGNGGTEQNDLGLSSLYDECAGICLCGICTKAWWQCQTQGRLDC